MIKNILRNIYKKSLSNDKRVRIYQGFGTGLDFRPVQKYDMFYHIDLLKKLGFSPSLIVDVGAYRGEWTRRLLEIFPDSTFLMVEAQHSKATQLQQMTKSYNNVFFENVLLGDMARDKVKFFEMETGSSIYEENTSCDRTESFLEMKTLDEVVRNYRVDGNCFLKMDVQGAEIDVLKGGDDFLNKVEFILLEVSTLNYNENSPDFAAVVSFLNDIGYLLFDICEEHRTDANVLFQVDLIFVKKMSGIRDAVKFKRRK